MTNMGSCECDAVTTGPLSAQGAGCLSQCRRAGGGRSRQLTVVDGPFVTPCQEKRLPREPFKAQETVPGGDKRCCPRSLPEGKPAAGNTPSE
jgi:hypothetical protein